MNFEDIVAIIIVIIFFVGPLFKKIAEAAAAKPEEQPRKGRSLEEAREYLENMKAQKSPGHAEYRAPASKPYKSLTKEKVSVKKKEEPLVAIPVPVVIHPEPEVSIVKRSVEKNFLKEFMTSAKFTEAQKAIILAEIFRQPSTSITTELKNQWLVK